MNLIAILQIGLLVVVLFVWLLWTFEIRRQLLMGTRISIIQINFTMLLLFLPVGFIIFSINSFNLLWIIPIGLLVSFLSVSFPFSILSIFGTLYYRLISLDLDHDVIEKMQTFRDRISEIIREDNVSVEEAVKLAKIELGM